MVLPLTSLICLSNSSAQLDPQLSLPEGVIARIGKGGIKTTKFFS